jgi:hypothetical protein
MVRGGGGRFILRGLLLPFRLWARVFGFNFILILTFAAPL